MSYVSKLITVHNIRSEVHDANGHMAEVAKLILKNTKCYVIL
jgi:hypothetical protein